MWVLLKEVKQALLKQPQSIVNLLEHYGFANIHIRNNEIRCAIAEGHNSSAICIRLEKNDGLYVTDFVRNICDDNGHNYDLIGFIINVKGATFTSVLMDIKAELGIADFYRFDVKKSIFGGFYEHIKTGDTQLAVRTYSDYILKDYFNVYARSFLLDHIAPDIQDKFQIGYDIVSQRITIPIRNQYGELIGVKGRATWNVGEDEPKYLYIIPCPMSTTLYGYCQNYEHLQQANTIYIGESEKFVMQASSYGLYNCVALGSNSLSTAQCKLLLELHPKKIVFMLDKGLSEENTRINAKKLSMFTRMADVKIYWWDWKINIDLPDKASPSDFGKEEIQWIIENEIEEVVL